MIDIVIIPLLKIAVVLNGVLVLVTVMPLLERKVQGWVQSRLGPMRVGPWGLLQAIVDPIKLMMKEDITPTKADKWLFTLAPIMAMVPALAVFSVIPFGGDALFYITDINVGLLFIISVTSIGVYGIILAGWASNSKYPMLGALRSAAQMVSYEVALGFAIIGVLLVAGSLSLVEIVQNQQQQQVWYIFYQPVAFVLFFICGLAETNRLPFDLPEAETELVGGFHTEYSGFRFSLFFLAEYAIMIAVSAIGVILFLGGWLRPFPNSDWLSFLDFIPGVLWFLGKVFVFLYVFIWLRGTLPRFRFDQLMQYGWKIFLPVALGNVVVTAGVLLAFL